MTDAVTEVCSLREITAYEVFEFSFAAEYGCITRQDIAHYERDYRSYKRSGRIPSYTEMWCANQRKRS